MSEPIPETAVLHPCYKVIRCKDEEDLAIVPSNWFKEDKLVYWPNFQPKDITKFDKAILKREQPGTDWKLCKVETVYGSAAQYAMAVEILRFALRNSEDELDKKLNNKRSRASRHKKARDSDSEYEDSKQSSKYTYKKLKFNKEKDDDDFNDQGSQSETEQIVQRKETTELTGFPTPPKILNNIVEEHEQTTAKSSMNGNGEEIEIDGFNDSEVFDTGKENENNNRPLRVKSDFKFSGISNLPNQKIASKPLLPDLTNKNKENLASNSSNTAERNGHNNLDVIEPTQGANALDFQAFHVLNTDQRIAYIAAACMNMAKEIALTRDDLHNLRRATNEQREDLIMNALQFDEFFPITSNDTLIAFQEKLINNQNFKNKIIKYFNAFGDDTGHITMRKMLGKLISDNVANLYTFEGNKYRKRRKLKFKGLEIWTILKNIAMAREYPLYTEDKAKRSCELWLIGSTQRIDRSNQ